MSEPTPISRQRAILQEFREANAKLILAETSAEKQYQLDCDAARRDRDTAVAAVDKTFSDADGVRNGFYKEHGELDPRYLPKPAEESEYNGLTHLSSPLRLLLWPRKAQPPSAAAAQEHDPVAALGRTVDKARGILWALNGTTRDFERWQEAQLSRRNTLISICIAAIIVIALALYFTHVIG